MQIYKVAKRDAPRIAKKRKGERYILMQTAK